MTGWVVLVWQILENRDVLYESSNPSSSNLDHIQPDTSLIYTCVQIRIATRTESQETPDDPDAEEVYAPAV